MFFPSLGGRGFTLLNGKLHPTRAKLIIIFNRVKGRGKFMFHPHPHPPHCDTVSSRGRGKICLI